MIKLVRVDHRLLHGQVAFSWTKVLGTDCILIANDAVAKDSLRMAALRMAKPEGIRLVMKSIEDSITSLNSGVTDKYKLLIIVESVEDAYRLSEKVDVIKMINLGGAKLIENRRQISKAFSVSDKDCELLRKMNDKGIRLEIQMVPDEPAKDVMDLI